MLINYRVNKMNNNKEKKTFRLYAIVLFIFASFVLLWTGYSQNKINENYKNRLNDKENENIKFEYNLNSALEENKKLNGEIEKLKKDLSEAQDNTVKLEKEIKTLKETQQKTLEQYEKVLKADFEYSNGNIKECALILLEIKENSLKGDYILKKYNELKNKAYKEAAKLFYFDGYDSFKKKNYKIAIDNFNNSLKLTEDEYFSDDCYYLSAYCGYYIKDYDFSKEMIDKLLNKYPESDYNSEAKSLLKMIENAS